MSYKQKIVSAVAAGFAVVSFSAFASAQDNTANQPQDSTQKQERREHRGYDKRGENGEGWSGKEGRYHGDKMGMRELRQLNLTDAQKQQVRSVMEGSRKANPETFQELKQLSQAKRDGSITPEQMERLKTLKQQKRQNFGQMQQQILAILTPEQRTQLEQLKNERREQMNQRREMRKNQQQPDTQTDN